MDSRLDKVIWPGWDVVRKIGSGSFGAVYEIQRVVRGRTEHAALKVITIPTNKSEISELRVDGYDDASITKYFADSMERIEDEYAMMADMKGHANVVYCDDLRTIQHDDGFGWDIYIKMELLTPMKDALSGTVTDEQVIKCGIDICNALILCKQLNIVHRDIKPENIFMSRDGGFKLGDFGIARTMEGTTGATITGTYDYMAPEVYNNRPYHSEADIYSLGLVLYWLLNKRKHPFVKTERPTPSEKIEARGKRFSGEAVPAPENGSAELKTIVQKACAYEPKDRYENPADMKRELEALLYGVTPEASEPVNGGIPAVLPVSMDFKKEKEDLTMRDIDSKGAHKGGSGSVGIVEPQEEEGNGKRQTKRRRAWTVAMCALLLLGVFLGSMAKTANSKVNASELVMDSSMADESLPKPSEVPIYEYLVVTTASNIRSGPSTDYDIVNTAEAGTILGTIIGKSADWYHVAYEGQKGYIFENLVTVRNTLEDYKDYVIEYKVAGTPTIAERLNAENAIRNCDTVEEVESCSYVATLIETVLLSYADWMAAGMSVVDVDFLIGDPSGESGDVSFEMGGASGDEDVLTGDVSAEMGGVSDVAVYEDMNSSDTYESETVVTSTEIDDVSSVVQYEEVTYEEETYEEETYEAETYEEESTVTSESDGTSSDEM